MTRTVTSASNFHRRVGCPGSENMERGLAEVETPWAERGRILHDLWAHPRLSREKLTDEELEQLDAVELVANEFREQLFGTEPIHVFIEEPVTLFAGTPFEMRSTPDQVYWSQPLKIIAVPDAKFGRMEVDEAADNWQIATYLCALADKFPAAETFYGLIIQPWAKKSAPVKYTRAELEATVRIMIDHLTVCQSPNAPLNPTVDNCRYCKGAQQAVCPAHRDFALAPVKEHGVERAVKDPTGFLLSLEKHKRTQILDAITMAYDLGAVLRPAAKGLIRMDKDAVPGYSVQRDTEARKITDLPNAILALEKLGATPGQVLEALKMSVTDAEKVIRDLTKLKGKELKAKSDALLRPVCDITPREGNLIRE